MLFCEEYRICFYPNFSIEGNYRMQIKKDCVYIKFHTNISYIYFFAAFIHNIYNTHTRIQLKYIYNKYALRCHHHHRRRRHEQSAGFSTFLSNGFLWCAAHFCLYFILNRAHLFNGALRFLQ